MTTFPAAIVAPKSVMNLPRNSFSLSLSIAMMTLPCLAPAVMSHFAASWRPDNRAFPFIRI
jgi:hypothetical protein